MKKQSSLFLKAYGDSPILKVLDFLVVFQDFDYSMKDTAKKAKISYTTLKQIWPELVKRKIVRQTRIVGKAKMFKLDTNNPEVQLFMKLYWMTVERQTRKLLPVRQVA